jgi:hypothetical protein
LRIIIDEPIPEKLRGLSLLKEGAFFATVYDFGDCILFSTRRFPKLLYISAELGAIVDAA